MIFCDFGPKASSSLIICWVSLGLDVEYMLLFPNQLSELSCFAGSKIPEQQDWWAVQAFLNSCGDLLAGRAAEDRSHNAKSLRLMAKFMSDTGNKCITRLKYYAWWAHWG